MATIRFSGRFDGTIDKLHTRAYRHVIEQVFNIIVAQADAALADAQTNTKVGISAMNSVQLTNVDRIQPHRVILTRWHVGR